MQATPFFISDETGNRYRVSYIDRDKVRFRNMDTGQVHCVTWERFNKTKKTYLNVKEFL
jgi:hypothetical protein